MLMQAKVPKPSSNVPWNNDTPQIFESLPTKNHNLILIDAPIDRVAIVSIFELQAESLKTYGKMFDRYITTLDSSST
ncbi:hypothetical protein CEXT_95921 [Caerostris extrusa]|uniref:Uncharacterized protein n=1 Tax=Caerostris extrusa TaxID=172846 RepID=A0AAV4XZ97_CAEEX|nr:hypothetical protein CEXT_95921 [Caerostris extrusa]